MTAIVTKRTLLVPFNGHFADARTMVSWLNDKELMKFSEQRHRKHDYHTQIRYIDSFIEPSLFRVITAGGKLIGTITAHVDKHNQVADMGILIGDKTLHGLGYGTETWMALMAHLFGTGIRKIEAGCMGCNQGMISVFKKTKMVKESRREKHFILESRCGGTNRGMFTHKYIDLEQWAKYHD